MTDPQIKLIEKVTAYILQNENEWEDFETYCEDNNLDIDEEINNEKSEHVYPHVLFLQNEAVK